MDEKYWKTLVPDDFIQYSQKCVVCSDYLYGDCVPMPTRSDITIHAACETLRSEKKLEVENACGPMQLDDLALAELDKQRARLNELRVAHVRVEKATNDLKEKLDDLGILAKKSTRYIVAQMLESVLKFGIEIKSWNKRLDHAKDAKPDSVCLTCTREDGTPLYGGCSVGQVYFYDDVVWPCYNCVSKNRE